LDWISFQTPPWNVQVSVCNRLPLNPPGPSPPFRTAFPAPASHVRPAFSRGLGDGPVRAVGVQVPAWKAQESLRYDGVAPLPAPPNRKTPPRAGSSHRPGMTLGVGPATVRFVQPPGPCVQVWLD
jgi:hypothetical protein